MIDQNLIPVFLILGAVAIIYELAVPGVGWGGFLGVLFLYPAVTSLRAVPPEWIGAIRLIAVMALIFFGYLIWACGRLRRKPPVTGAEGMVGKRAVVRPEGLVYMDGALWSVEFGAEGLPPGTVVLVTGVVGNRLIVEKEV